jgi:hypothetical protein
MPHRRSIASGPPGLRSLGGAWRFGILPALGTYAGSWGMGNPVLAATGGSRPDHTPASARRSRSMASRRAVRACFVAASSAAGPGGATVNR